MAHDNPESAKARVARWRDKKRAVTSAAMQGTAQAHLQVAQSCTKCNGTFVCPEHEKLREEVFKAFNLQVERATHLARQNIATGGYGAMSKGTSKAEKCIATHERDTHGHSYTNSYTHDDDTADQSKPVRVGRYTARAGTKDFLQVVAEELINAEQEQRQGIPVDFAERRFSMWVHAVLYTTDEYAVTLRRQFPNYTWQEYLKVVWASPLGKKIWKQLMAGERLR